MAKFQLDTPGKWDYPALGLSAKTGAILDGALSDPAITSPPDSRWSAYAGGAAEVNVTRYAPPATQPTYTEPQDGYVLRYSHDARNYVPQPAMEAESGVLDPIVAGRIDDPASQTAASLSAAVSNPGAVARTRLDEIFGRGVSVLAPEWGAIGDGVTNDTAAIQAAIDAMATAKGGTVYLPAGRFYAVTSLTLRTGVSLVSASGAYAYLAGVQGARGAVLRGTQAGAWVIDGASSATTMAIRGVNVACQNLANGIRFNNASWSKIQDVCVDGSVDQAIYLKSTGPSVANSLVDILVTNAVLNRTRAAVTGAVEVEGTDHYLDRIEATPSLTQGTITDANLRVAAIYLKGDNHFISKLVGEFADIGIYAACSGSRISDVRADHNGGHGIYVTGSENQWSNPTSQTNGLAASGVYDGWWATTNAVGNQVSNLRVRQVGAGRYRNALRDEVNTGASPYALNRYINPVATHALGGFANDINVQDFLGSSIQWPAAVTRATNATPSVRGYTVVQMAQDAPLTVTDFLYGTPGQEITVIGNVQPTTIANNARITTTTGFSKALASGRAYRFLYAYGKWTEVG